MARILVTGADGQLGMSYKKLADDYVQHHFYFFSRIELDIQDGLKLRNLISKYKIDYVINCAAYTAVDKAEEQTEKAFRVNESAVEILANSCQQLHVGLIHYSTDFVFDGKASKAYLIDHESNPINTYGQSKLAGEKVLESYNDLNYAIIRTSWVYSEFGHNFLKTMLRLFKEMLTINIVNDQHGIPTYATDLAIFTLAVLGNKMPKILHFSNEGPTTWFEFAEAIKSFSNSNIKIVGIPSSKYPTSAKRPKYSVLDLSYSRQLFGPIRHWREALKECMQCL